MSKIFLYSTTLLLISSGLVWAQNSYDASQSQYDANAWLVTIKANVSVSPKWNGSDEFSGIGYPSVSFRRPWTAEEWSSPSDSIGFAFIDTNGFSLGVVGAYRGGRDSSSVERLIGLRDTRWTIEGGLFAQYWFAPEFLRARLEVRRGFRSEDGFIADLGADLVHKYDRFTFALGPRVSVADGRFMRNHFGVTYEDSIRNGDLSEWRPDGGLRAAGIFSSVNYRINDQWTAGVHGGWERLLGDARKSPIIEKAGDENQFLFGATVTYTFDWKW